MPNIDLSILNQRQTPAFYADVFANRPAAGFVGRIFVSTDTFAFYRDNGTGWDLIGGPGTGTVTGTGANGQVTFWNGASTITGSNDLFWDATNGHLGVNTNAPGTALDVHHDQSTVAILNQTTATNDVRIGFQNNGVGLWRIGAFYNAGANDFGIYDAVGAIQPVTVKKTTGQVLIGTSTVGAGKLVVASASSDNGVQIVGASAPSLRIDNAESGPTKRAGLGISTATNNFIQGSADRDFCIFNGSTAAASPILFGVYDAVAVNVQEAARISAARNFLIGTTTDGGYKLNVNGTTNLSNTLTIGPLGTAVAGIQLTGNDQSNTRLKITNSGGSSFSVVTGNPGASNNGFAIYDETAAATRLYISTTGNVGISTASPDQKLTIQAAGTSNGLISFKNAAGTTTSFIGVPNANGNVITTSTTADLCLRTETGAILFGYDNVEKMRIAVSTGNLLIGTTTDAGQKLQVSGNGLFTSGLTSSTTFQLQSLYYYNGGGVNDIYASTNGRGAGSGNFAIVNTVGSANTAILCSTTSFFRIGTTSQTAATADKFAVDISTGNVLIGTTTSGGSKLRIVGLPTSAAGLSSGDIYSNAGILTIVP